MNLGAEGVYTMECVPVSLLDLSPVSAIISCPRRVPAVGCHSHLHIMYIYIYVT